MRDQTSFFFIIFNRLQEYILHKKITRRWSHPLFFSFLQTLYIVKINIVRYIVSKVGINVKTSQELRSESSPDSTPSGTQFLHEMPLQLPHARYTFDTILDAAALPVAAISCTVAAVN